MSADPTSGNSSEFAAVETEKAWYIGQYLSAVLLGKQVDIFSNNTSLIEMHFIGAQMSLVVQSTYYLANGRYPRIKKIIFILYGFLLIALVAIGDSTNETQGFLMWITNRDIPGGPEAYLNSHLSAWFNVWGTSAILAANFMGDALLVK